MHYTSHEHAHGERRVGSNGAGFLAFVGSFSGEGRGAVSTGTFSSLLTSCTVSFWSTRVTSLRQSKPFPLSSDGIVVASLVFALCSSVLFSTSLLSLAIIPNREKRRQRRRIHLLFGFTHCCWCSRVDSLKCVNRSQNERCLNLNGRTTKRHTMKRLQ